MAWVDLSWSSEEQITSTKLNQMDANTEHVKTFVAYNLLFFFNMGSTDNETSFTTYAEGKVYIPSNCETLLIKTEVVHGSVGNTVSVRTSVDSSLQVTQTFTGTNVEFDETTLDVSSLDGDQWYDIEIEAMTTNSVDDYTINHMHVFAEMAE